MLQSVQYSFLLLYFFFFFNDTATTEIYTLSLHDALPISTAKDISNVVTDAASGEPLFRSIGRAVQQECRDRKSGSAGMPRPISYAVFCLKKKKNKEHIMTQTC